MGRKNCFFICANPHHNSKQPAKPRNNKPKNHVFKLFLQFAFISIFASTFIISGVLTNQAMAIDTWDQTLTPELVEQEMIKDYITMASTIKALIENSYTMEVQEKLARQKLKWSDLNKSTNELNFQYFAKYVPTPHTPGGVQPTTPQNLYIRLVINNNKEIYDFVTKYVELINSSTDPQAVHIKFKTGIINQSLVAKLDSACGKNCIVKVPATVTNLKESLTRQGLSNGALAPSQIEDYDVKSDLTVAPDLYVVFSNAPNKTTSHPTLNFSNSSNADKNTGILYDANTSISIVAKNVNVEKVLHVYRNIYYKGIRNVFQELDVRFFNLSPMPDLFSAVPQKQLRKYYTNIPYIETEQIVTMQKTFGIAVGPEFSIVPIPSVPPIPPITTIPEQPTATPMPIPTFQPSVTPIIPDEPDPTPIPITETPIEDDPTPTPYDDVEPTSPIKFDSWARRSKATANAAPPQERVFEYLPGSPDILLVNRGRWNLRFPGKNEYEYLTLSTLVVKNNPPTASAKTADIDVLSADRLHVVNYLYTDTIFTSADVVKWEKKKQGVTLKGQSSKGNLNLSSVSYSGKITELKNQKKQNSNTAGSIDLGILLDDISKASLQIADGNNPVNLATMDTTKLKETYYPYLAVPKSYVDTELKNIYENKTLWEKLESESYQEGVAAFAYPKSCPDNKNTPWDIKSKSWKTLMTNSGITLEAYDEIQNIYQTYFEGTATIKTSSTKNVESTNDSPIYDLSLPDVSQNLKTPPGNQTESWIKDNFITADKKKIIQCKLKTCQGTQNNNACLFDCSGKLVCAITKNKQVDRIVVKTKEECFLNLK